jgi:cytoskeletal protein CcmA (bactofilin family)
LKLGQRRKRRTVDQVREFSTVIGPDSRFVGKFLGKEHFVVYGHVNGECDIEGTVILGETGVWEGNVRAANVVIAGHITGDVRATIKVELAPTARISGNISSPVVAIAEGAVYDGKIDMQKETRLTHFNERRAT